MHVTRNQGKGDLKWNLNFFITAKKRDLSIFKCQFSIFGANHYLIPTFKNIESKFQVIIRNNNVTSV